MPINKLGRLSCDVKNELLYEMTTVTMTMIINVEISAWDVVNNGSNNNTNKNNIGTKTMSIDIIKISN